MPGAAFALLDGISGFQTGSFPSPYAPIGGTLAPIVRKGERLRKHDLARYAAPRPRQT